MILLSNKKSITLWIVAAPAASATVLLLLLLTPFTLFLAPTPTQAALSDGLVGYWTFDGKDTNWGTNKTNDLSGQGNTGTLTSMSTTTSPAVGKLGQGLKFDGVNDLINMGDVLDFERTDPFSISAWIRLPTATPTADNCIVSKLATRVGYRICIRGDVANDPVEFELRGSTQQISKRSTQTWVANNWTHIVWTNNGNSAASGSLLYRNGVLQSATTEVDDLTSQSIVTSGNLVIGDGPVFDTPFFIGNIDDVRIYNRALSATEIGQLYKVGAAKLAVSPVNTLKSGLVGYWTFDGKDTNWGTNKTNDLSGQGNTGTLTNMSTTTSPVVGKIGQGLKFDGASNYVNLGDINAIDTATQLTACAWVYHSSLSNDHMIFSKIASLTSGFLLQRDNVGSLSGREETYTAFVEDSSSVNQVQLEGATNASKLNTWTYVCMTFIAGSATGLRLYVNGVEDANSPENVSVIAAINAGSELLRVGHNNALNRYFHGQMDDVRIYNRALSATEIQQLYKVGAAKLAVSPVNSIKSGLVGYWTFDGKDTNWTKNQTNDLSGNGNTGTLVSMSTTTSPAVGKIGQGLLFDGSNDRIAMDDVLDMGTSNWTATAWVKTTGTNGSIVVGKSNFVGGANPDGWWMGLQASERVQCVFFKTGRSIFSAVDDGVIVNDGKWHHITCVWARTGNMTRYVDGAQTGTNTSISGESAQNLNSTEPFLIGDRAVFDVPLNGLIDDVRIYNRALSATEIGQLYKLGSSKSR